MLNTWDKSTLRYRVRLQLQLQIEAFKTQYSTKRMAITNILLLL